MKSCSQEQEDVGLVVCRNGLEILCETRKKDNQLNLKRQTGSYHGPPGFLFYGVSSRHLLPPEGNCYILGGGRFHFDENFFCRKAKQEKRSVWLSKGEEAET